MLAGCEDEETDYDNKEEIGWNNISNDLEEAGWADKEALQDDVRAGCRDEEVDWDDVEEADWDGVGEAD